MKFKSAIVTEGSGKLGGSVFSRNRYGQYVRPFRMPINPRTNLQETARAALSDGSKAWASITEPQRAAWVEYAKTVSLKDALGNTYHPTGQNAFVGAFALQVDMRGTAPDPVNLDPTYTRVPGSVSITSASAPDGHEVEILFDLQLDPLETLNAGSSLRLRVYNFTGQSNPSGSRALVGRVVVSPTGVPLSFPGTATVILEQTYPAGVYSVKIDAVWQQPDGRASTIFQQVLTVTVT